MSLGARRRLRILQVGWGVLTVFGLYRLTDQDLRGEISYMAGNNAREERTVAEFMATADPQVFVGKAWMDFQCEPTYLASDLLMDPAVRAVMPALVHPPLPLPAAHRAGKVHRLDAGEGANIGVSGQGWLLASPPAGQPASVFRSETMATELSRLLFQVWGPVGGGVQLNLVGETSGRVTPLLPDAEANGLWTTIVRIPAEPFHLSAQVDPGSRRVLAFFEAQGIGRLTVWVDPLFRSSIGWLFAGALLWMGAAAYRWQAPEPVVPDGPVAMERPTLPSIEPVLTFPAAREPLPAVHV